MKTKINYDMISKDEYFIKSPAGNLPWVQRVASEHWGPEFFMTRNFTDKVFIAFVQKGQARIGFPDKPAIDVNPGSILSLTPFCEHSITSHDPAGLHLLVFLLTNEKGVELARKYLPPTASGLLLADPSRVEALFYRLLETAEKGGFNTSAIAGSLVEPILLTIDQEYRSHSDAEDQVFALFTRCRVFIENNWEKITSVNDVPEHLGISQPYMGKLFRKYEKCTPHHFLLQQKMSYALYELQQGQITVAKIASQLGFADAYSFSKTFKRIMGKPPAAMR
jgi:AraC-like DNA-binding protein